VLIGILTGITHYSKAKKENGDPLFKTIPQVGQDLKDMKLVFETFDFDTRCYENPTYIDLEIMINSLYAEILAYYKKNKTVLVAAYFSGHGYEDFDGTLIVLDEDGNKNGYLDYKNYLFPLERKLRVITEDNVFTIPMFDCCRQKVRKKDQKGFEEFVNETVNGRRFITIHACDIREGVQVDSLVAKTVQKLLFEAAAK